MASEACCLSPTPSFSLHYHLQTKDDMVYVASEVGVLGDVLSNAENIVAKGRLGPGQMVCADLTEGEHCCPAGVKALGKEGDAWKGGWRVLNVATPSCSPRQAETAAAPCSHSWQAPSAPTPRLPAMWPPARPTPTGSSRAPASCLR